MTPPDPNLWSKAVIKDEKLTAFPVGTEVLVRRRRKTFKSIGATWWLFGPKQRTCVSQELAGGPRLHLIATVGPPVVNQDKADRLFKALHKRLVGCAKL